ncbi:hypothetical protein JKF63_07252 [Porcisia hertigi]|uniref:Uncharacterized protein n=1 Tax=Porcisia hertigi TaxID=2761500 RepID=A0A836LLA1_9TRYP|nr:hypothetical protein JKF63_07252 [Porcisia hertigi]
MATTTTNITGAKVFSEQDCFIDAASPHKPKRGSVSHSIAASVAVHMNVAPVEEVTVIDRRRKFGWRMLRHARLHRQRQRVERLPNNEYESDDGGGLSSILELRIPGHYIITSSLTRVGREVRSTSRCLCRRLLPPFRWRPWLSNAQDCEDRGALPGQNTYASDAHGSHLFYEHHRRFHGLLAPFWLSDAVVVLVTFLLFALLAVARVTIALGVVSAWATMEDSTAEREDGRMMYGTCRSGRRWLTATTVATAVPYPTEGLVGVLGLLSLAVEWLALRRWAKLLGQLLFSVSETAAAASGDTSGTRSSNPLTAHEQHRPLRRSSRKPSGGGVSCGNNRNRLGLSCSLFANELYCTETAESVAIGATMTASMATATAVPPIRFRHVLTVTSLMFTLQLFPDAAWAWAAAVLLTTGSAMASLVEAVVDPLRWVSTEYRHLVNRSWWELFFSVSFTPFSLDLLNVHGQHVMNSVLATTAGFLSGMDPPAEVGKIDWLAKRAHTNRLVTSPDVGSSFGNRLRRYAHAQRNVRVSGGRGSAHTLGVARHIGVSLHGNASSPSRSSVVTSATLFGEGVGSVDSGSGLYGWYASGPVGVAGGDATVGGTSVSPMEFWHRVAAKVLQQSGKATGEVAGVAVPGSDPSRARESSEFMNGLGPSAVGERPVLAGGRGYCTGSASGSGEGTNTGAIGLRSPAAATESTTPARPSKSLLGVPDDPFSGTTAASAMLYAVPRVSPLVMLSPRRGIEHLNPGHAGFTPENLKGSMLLTLPSVARVGGATGEAELDPEEHLFSMERVVPRQGAAAAAAMRTRRRYVSPAIAVNSEPFDEEGHHLNSGGPLATVVVPSACSHVSHRGDAGGCTGEPFPAVQPSTRAVFSSTSFAGRLSSLGAAAARLLVKCGEGLQRLVDYVRCHSHNTSSLERVSAVYKHLYGMRMDIKERGAVHYAAVARFVYRAVLSRIGVHLNLSDKAGYAPLHSAVHHHTKARLSPHVTFESPSGAVQGARHGLGITMATTVPVQATHMDSMEADSSAVARSRTTVKKKNPRSRDDLRMRSILGHSPVVSPTPGLALPPQRRPPPKEICSPAAAAVPKEEHEQDMNGALVRLGAPVNLPTATGVTALHLAVMQGSVRLASTLLCEDANPLVGVELEALSLPSPISAASWRESDSDSEEVDTEHVDSTVAQLRELVGLLITNASHSTTRKHPESPLFLTVRLDEELAGVANMWRHAPSQASTAQVVPGPSPGMVSVALLRELPPPTLLPAPPGSPSPIDMISVANVSLSSRGQSTPLLALLPVDAGKTFSGFTGHSAASLGLSTSTAPSCSASLESVRHLPEDSPVGDAAMTPLLSASVAFTAAAATTINSHVSTAHQPIKRPWSPAMARVAHNSVASDTPTTPVATALASPWTPTRQLPWCDLHGFSPLHSALIHGDAGMTGALLLGQGCAEAIANDHAPTAAPQKAMEAERVGRKALDSDMQGPPMSPQVIAAFDGATSNFWVGEAPVRQHQPVLDHTTMPLAEKAEGRPQNTDVSERKAAAAAATLSLVPSAGPTAFWVLPLRMNLFHLAALGNSTECLAYVLYWRGAPDYIPCELNVVFQDELQAKGGGSQKSTTATPGTQRRRRQHHRKKKRGRAYRSSQAMSNIAGLAEALAVPTKANALNTEEDMVPVSPKTSNTSTTRVHHMVTCGADATAAEAGALLHKFGDPGDVCKPFSSLLPAAAATSAVAAEVATALHELPEAPSTGLRTFDSAEMALKTHGDGRTFSTTPYFFPKTWSTGRLSPETHEAAYAAAKSTPSQRARRMRPRQQAFMHALATLLYTDIRLDAVRRRVRATVFGRGTLGNAASPASAHYTRRRPPPRPARTGRVPNGGSTNSHQDVHHVLAGPVVPQAVHRHGKGAKRLRSLRYQRSRALQQALLIVNRGRQHHHCRMPHAARLGRLTTVAVASQHDGQASGIASNNELTAITAALGTVYAPTGTKGNVCSKDGGSCCRRGSSLASACAVLPSLQPHCSSPHPTMTTNATTDKEKLNSSGRQRQSTLWLLRTLSAELNAVDARGLTPLHYAIANRNARMVYLLCAYGATFLFASEETMTHFLRHSAEAIAAAAAAVGRRSGGDNRATSATASSEHIARQSGALSSTTANAAAAVGDSLAAATQSTLSAFPPASAAAAIAAATVAISSSGERYYARLTPTTRAALRQVAKTSSAEYLLGISAQEEREAERQQQQLLCTPPVPETADTPRGSAQHTGLPLLSLPPVVPTTTTTTMACGATGGKTGSLTKDNVHSTSSPMTKTASRFPTPPSPQPATMAATLTAALGIIDDARAAARPMPTWPGASLTGERVPSTTEDGASVDGADADALPVQLQSWLIDQDIQTLQSMIAGYTRSSSSINGSGGEGPAARPHSPPQRLYAGLNLDEARDETTIAANAVADTPSIQYINREHPLHFDTSSSAVLTPAAVSTSDLPATVEHTLLEPHDVFLTHVVRNPVKAHSIVCAAVEGTALRYLFLDAVTSGKHL